MTLLIRGRLGLGDNVYQRAVVRELAADRGVFLETPWPQIYRDLPNVRPVFRTQILRTQARNAGRANLAHVWHAPPAGARPQAIGYAGHPGSILEGLCATARIAPQRVTFDLPTFGPQRPRARPYVVFRPATVRKEWPAAARNPDPRYLAEAADILRDRFDIVSVADLVPGKEWALDPLPYADERYHGGELWLEDLLALMEGAAGAVGGVGWLLPVAMAYRVPLLLVYGGGRNDCPARILDPRLPTEVVTNALPDRFCMCADRQHTCDKRISGFAERVRQWVVGLHPRGQAAVAA